MEAVEKSLLLHFSTDPHHDPDVTSPRIFRYSAPLLSLPLFQWGIEDR